MILLHGWHKTSARWRAIFIARPITSNWSIIILNRGNAHLLLFWAPRAEPTHYTLWASAHYLPPTFLPLLEELCSSKRHKYISSNILAHHGWSQRGAGVCKTCPTEIWTMMQEPRREWKANISISRSVNQSHFPLDGAGSWNALFKRASLVFLRRD